MATYYEEGIHVCEVREMGWTETKKSPPRPMIILRVLPTHCVRVGPDGEDQLEVCTYTKYLQTIRLLVDSTNEQVMDMTLRKLRYAGFTGDSFADLNLVGAIIRCRNSWTENKGDTYDNFDMALPLREPAPIDKIDSNVVRKLDALFGRRLKSKPPKPDDQPPANDGGPLQQDMQPNTTSTIPVPF